MTKLPHRAGFSLVETIVAIAVASFAYIAILSLNTTNARVTASARDQATGTKIVEESVEALRTVRAANTGVMFGQSGTYVGWNAAYTIFPTSWNGNPATVPANAVFTLRYDAATNQWVLEEAFNGTPNYIVVGNTSFMRRVLVASDTDNFGNPIAGGLKVFQVEVCWAANTPVACFNQTTNPTHIIRQSVKMGPKTNIN